MRVMQVALITGAAGFCARHLVERLRRVAGMRIVGFDRQSTVPSGIPVDEYVGGDIRDARQVASVVQAARPDCVFHLAGLLTGSAEDVYGVNLSGGLRLLEAVHSRAPDAGVVIVGSAAEYGPVTDLPVREDHSCRPESPYALSKYALTLAALDYALRGRLKVIVVRPFNVIGRGIPSSLLVGALLERAKRALETPGTCAVPVGNVDTTRDFLAVEDAVDAYVRLLDCERWGEVFNVCSGQPRSVRSVAERLLSFSDRPLHLEADPFLKRPLDVPAIYGSSEKIERVIGFHPSIDMDVALRAAWDHHMEAVPCA